MHKHLQYRYCTPKTSIEIARHIYKNTYYDDEPSLKLERLPSVFIHVSFKDYQYGNETTHAAILRMCENLSNSKSRPKVKLHKDQIELTDKRTVEHTIVESTERVITLLKEVIIYNPFVVAYLFRTYFLEHMESNTFNYLANG